MVVPDTWFVRLLVALRIVAMELPSGVEAHIVPRSSTFKNFGIFQTNSDINIFKFLRLKIIRPNRKSQGVIDNSYCGDNDIWEFPAYATRDVTIPKGSRICQFRLNKTMKSEFGDVKFVPVETLGNSDRVGFGSTGK